MFKATLLALLLIFQNPLVTASMNKEGTRFSVAFPADTIIQACLKFESQTETWEVNGVMQPYTPTSCVVFMDNFTFVEGPNGSLTGVEGPTHGSGYVDEFPLNTIEGTEWKIWAEAQVASTGEWVKSNTLTWTNPKGSGVAAPRH